jgi:hypothetical protein
MTGVGGNLKPEKRLCFSANRGTLPHPEFKIAADEADMDAIPG